MARTTKQTKTPATPGFRESRSRTTPLGLAILVAEFGDGNYQPMGCGGEHQQGARNRRSDMRGRMRDREAGKRPTCPERYMVWAQGVGGDYARRRRSPCRRTRPGCRRAPQHEGDKTMTFSNRYRQQHHGLRRGAGRAGQRGRVRDRKGVHEGHRRMADQPPGRGLEQLRRRPALRRLETSEEVHGPQNGHHAHLVRESRSCSQSAPPVAPAKTEGGRDHQGRPAGAHVAPRTPAHRGYHASLARRRSCATC